MLALQTTSDPVLIVIFIPASNPGLDRVHFTFCTWPKQKKKKGYYLIVFNCHCLMVPSHMPNFVPFIIHMVKMLMLLTSIGLLGSGAKVYRNLFLLNK